MPANADLDALRAVQSIPDLLVYLRDRLDWPIEDSIEDLEELTYPYEAEEFGLKAEFAAKVRSIRQLRPLEADQPWGIFLVDFESKALPLVALRKILNGLAHKKRGGDRATWDKHDLLFISACGSEAERRVTFAHFSDQETDRLPVLKVLGWEEDDTARKVEHVRRELETKLVWPDLETEDADAWRERWASAFTQRRGEVIRTSKRLAERLAELARAIRDAVKAPEDDAGNLLGDKGALDVEGESGPLTTLLHAFRASLIQDLGAREFAGMYAQTIAYGLLAARVSRPAGLTPDDLTAMVPVTSPFLRDLLDTFLKAGGRRRGGRELDFDELGVNEVVDTLERADMEAVLRDFDHRNPQKDPVIHFYELFAKEFDPGEKIKRGEFYTPKPVVSYIVRGVHELLQSEFDLPDGLADTATWGEVAGRHAGLTIPDGTDPESHFVTILDPATGTGTFLVEAVDVIHRTLTDRWTAEGLRKPARVKAWNEYVPKHLLPRLYGYELKMAPYAVAHMKLGLKLTETGYKFPAADDAAAADARVRVYLTNALEPPRDFQITLDVPALAAEAKAVKRVKERVRFTAVVGNPPYSNFGMMNKGEFILRILKLYKKGLAEKKLNLNDDFIKFIRLGHYLLSRTGAGILGYILNNTYIDGITHRQMRKSLMDDFCRIYIADLHGSASKRETCPDGSADENVFDIQQGVGVGLFVSPPVPCAEASVSQTDIWGTREVKYRALGDPSAEPQSYEQLRPRNPYYFFAPKNFSRREEYERWPSLTDIFAANGPGVKTERDAVSIHWDQEGLQESVNAFLTLPEAEIRQRYGLGADSRDWKVANAKADVLENNAPRCYTRILYRPFDVRHIWYSGQTRGFVGTPGYPIMRNMLQANAIALLAMRQYEYKVPEYCYVFVSRHLSDNRTFVSNRGIANAFPLYTWPQSSNGSIEFGGAASRACGKISSVNKRGDSSRPSEVARVERRASPRKTASGISTPFFTVLRIEAGTLIS